jgi:ubiquitin-conjugating enzyme E2 G1
MLRRNISRGKDVQYRASDTSIRRVRSSSLKCLENWWKRVEAEGSPFYSAGLIGDNLQAWRVVIIGPPGSPYEGGLFPTRVDFPDDFPLMPPKVRFLCPMWHPNIDGRDGTVCLSILHAPGVDELNPEESASERWLPVHTMESIVLSVLVMLVMLSDPNVSSPLNVEAARQLRNDVSGYWDRVGEDVERSVEYCG